MATQSETSSSVSEVQSTKSSQDAMRTRVRLFAEGVVKMVSPVLLALALRKVDLKGEGTLFVFVQRSISPIAAVTMALGILLMVLLWLCLSKIFARVEWLQDAASKLLVHICAILLMCLAYFILLLISMDYKVYIAIVLPLVVFITYCYICSLRGEGDDDDGEIVVAQHAADYERELEGSVDFFAAFTVLLFLGLERVALESHLNSSNREGIRPQDHLESTLAVSFITCVLGVAIMFIWTVPPSPSLSNDEESKEMRRYIEASNVVLALLIATVVLWITWAPLNTWALLVIVPPLVSFLLGIYEHIDSLVVPPEKAQDKLNNTTPGSQEQQQSDQPDVESATQSQAENQQINTTSSSLPPDDDSQPIDTPSSSPADDSEVKPPPLELMKFAFAGFLTVSIPSIRDCSLTSSWTHAFILFTAISVVSALLWRLLPQRAKTPRAVVVAADVASFFAHAFAVAALVPFAVMADRNARLVVPDCLR